MRRIRMPVKNTETSTPCLRFLRIKENNEKIKIKRSRENIIIGETE